MNVIRFFIIPALTLFFLLQAPLVFAFSLWSSDAEIDCELRGGHSPSIIKNFNNNIAKGIAETGQLPHTGTAKVFNNGAFETWSFSSSVNAKVNKFTLKLKADVDAGGFNLGSSSLPTGSVLASLKYQDTFFLFKEFDSLNPLNIPDDTLGINFSCHGNSVFKVGGGIAKPFNPTLSCFSEFIFKNPFDGWQRNIVTKVLGVKEEVYDVLFPNSIKFNAKPDLENYKEIIQTAKARWGYYYYVPIGVELWVNAGGVAGTVSVDLSNTIELESILFSDGTTPESHGWTVGFISGLPSPNVPQPAPLPSSFILMGVGIAGLISPGVLRRRSRYSR